MSDELILRLRALDARPDDVSEVGRLWKLYVASCGTDGLVSAENEQLSAENKRLRAEVERLREALRRIAAIDTYSRRTWIMAVQAAREALKEDGR